MENLSKCRPKSTYISLSGTEGLGLTQRRKNRGGRRIVTHPYVFPPKASPPGRPVLLLLFDVYVLGVDYAFVFLGFGWGGIRTGRWAGSGGVGFVEDLGQPVAGGGWALWRCPA